jgi:thiopurine S-methyltransferase
LLEPNYEKEDKMETSFWHEKWAKKEIAFHETKVNPILVGNLAKLELDEGARLFLPLCGKTKDIAWLLSQGFQVVGAELSEVAIGELFEEMGVTPHIERHDAFSHFSAEGLDIYVGDIFTLSTAVLGAVDAIYDRAAMVALPSPMRERYVQHLRKITHNVKQLLVCFEYEQALLPGPPFAVSEDEVRAHYAAYYELCVLQAKAVAGGLKGKVEAVEKVYLLRTLES